jgi:hypothetical protein
MLFEAISPDEVRVYLNFFEMEICDQPGPFNRLLSNAEKISPIIDVHELIQLLSPSLKFKERLGVFWSLAIYPVVLFIVIGCTVDFKDKTQSDYSFVFGLVSVATLEVVIMVVLIIRFRIRLVKFIDSLNETVLHRRCVHLSYSKHCCGKNVMRLGIRRHYEDSLLMNT